MAASRWSWLVPVIATAAPCCSSARAIARPIPREPPVTNATLPDNDSICSKTTIPAPDHDDGLHDDAGRGPPEREQVAELARDREWSDAEEGEGPIQLEEEVPVRLNLSADHDPGGILNEVVIQERGKDVRFAYLDPKSEDEIWEESWDGREKLALPRAVRLSYRNHDGEEIRWIFPVMMSVLAQ